MTDEINRGPSLLQAIIDEPDADDLRLIYADWLTDHGEEERAEFIRVQVELARRNDAFDQRELLILSRQIDRKDSFLCWGDERTDDYGWNGTGSTEIEYSSGVEAIWRKGFLHTIRCPTAIWLRHRVELVRRHPLKEVRLIDKEPSSGNSSVEFLRDKFRWTIVPDSIVVINAPPGYWLHKTLVGEPTDLLHERWSVHDTREEADAWLSAKLISHAKELARNAY